MRKKIVYVVMDLWKWEQLKAHTPFPMPVQPLDGSFGFMLVYRTLKELKANMPKGVTYKKMVMRPYETHK